MKDLFEVIKKLHPRFLRLQDETYFTPEDIDWKLSSRAIEETLPTRINPISEIIFVDSRRRSHISINVFGFTMIIAQIATGSAKWSEKDGCSLLFSTKNPPVIKTLLAMSQETADRFGLNPSDLVKVGSLVCEVVVGKTPKSALDSEMQHLERQEVERRIQQGELIIKDGGIDFTTPAFEPTVGPVGLVKNVHISYVDPETFIKYGSMKAGERSHCRAVKMGRDFVRVMSYVKLIDREGMRGLVRIETSVEERYLKEHKASILQLFSDIASVLPFLTDDIPLPRLPEDILPIMFLEQALDNYLLSRDYVSNMTLREG
ncbi:MAG: hypothetical protein J7J68_01350 [Thermotogaceae bacterium]|nr:hypothetical protein [Thermotogaceae bacterium]